jgi:hypothetical protein
MLCPNLQLPKPNTQSLYSEVAIAASQFQQGFFRGFCRPFQFGKFLSSVPALTPLLSSIAPGHSPGLAGLVDGDRVRCMVFALGTVSVYFFWKLQSCIPTKGTCWEAAAHLFIFPGTYPYLYSRSLSNQALSVLEG